MLTVKAQCNLTNAEQYFQEHLSTGDYYTENKQAMGEWIGRGAERLNLRGVVKLEDFVKLCHNVDPNTDTLLTQRLKGTRTEFDSTGRAHRVANRRVFYDFTLSPPKSVSIAALVGGDRTIEDSHNRAVAIAMRELENFAAARIRKNRAATYRVTGNIVGAVFRHDTSRALDPHIHSHCIVFNATHDSVEARWKALETYEMLMATKYAENVYYHELARDLRRFGYEIENSRRGDFEIKGIPQELIERFSKRHAEIDERTAEFLERAPEKRDGNLNDVREHIAHNRRARKIKDLGRAQLAAIWDGQLQAGEKSIFAGLSSQSETHSVSKQPTTAELAITWAEEHLFDRRSVVREHEVWRFALEHGRGGEFQLEDIRRATQVGDYIRNEQSRGKLTTRTALEREWDIVTKAKDGIGRYDPLNAKHTIQNPSLDEEQRRAVQHILRSRDFIVLFRGGAGTGKSYALKEVKAGLLNAGHPVQILAPQRQQAIDLERDGLGRGQTVSEFLTRRQMPERGVVIVDEAGQIGAKQMQDLLEMVTRHDGRLILSGDVHQHGPVEASDALRAIHKYSGLSAAVLTQIRRQDPALGKTAEQKQSITEYKRAVDAAQSGRLTESFDRLDKLGCITQCGLVEQSALVAQQYLQLAAAGQSTVVVSQTWSEIHKINDQIRAGLKAQKLIGSEDTCVTALQQVDLTNAQKRDERFYSPTSTVVFNTDVGGFKKGDTGKLLDIADAHLLIEGEQLVKAIPFKHLDRISVCEPVKLALAPGDRLQLKANARTSDGQQLANGELVTVKKIDADGRIKLEDGRTLEQKYRQFVRGYAVTSYAAQGKTADFVIFSDSAIRAATNQKQWYVTISRGRKGIKIFTSDKAQLRENVIRSGERELALELIEPRKSPQTGVIDKLRTKWRRSRAFVVDLLAEANKKLFRHHIRRSARTAQSIKQQIHQKPQTGIRI